MLPLQNPLCMCVVLVFFRVFAASPERFSKSTPRMDGLFYSVLLYLVTPAIFRNHLNRPTTWLRSTAADFQASRGSVGHPAILGCPYVWKNTSLVSPTITASWSLWPSWKEHRSTTCCVHSIASHFLASLHLRRRHRVVVPISSFYSRGPVDRWSTNKALNYLCMSAIVHNLNVFLTYVGAFRCINIYIHSSMGGCLPRELPWGHYRIISCLDLSSCGGFLWTGHRRMVPWWHCLIAVGHSIYASHLGVISNCYHNIQRAWDMKYAQYLLLWSNNCHWIDRKDDLASYKYGQQIGA